MATQEPNGQAAQPQAGEGLPINVGSTRWSRRHGLRGRVQAQLTPGGLLLRGERGGELLMAPEQVLRMRSVMESSRYGRYYSTRIWWQGDPKPLLLSVDRNQHHNYHFTVGNFASRTASLGGVQRLEQGATVFGALLGVLLMLPLLLGSLLVSIFVLTKDPWYQRMVPALVGVLAMGVVLVVARAIWPRPVRDWETYVQALQGGRKSPF